MPDSPATTDARSRTNPAGDSLGAPICTMLHPQIYLPDTCLIPAYSRITPLHVSGIWLKH